MPSRSIRDQMQMRPAPVPGIRPTSPQPRPQVQVGPQGQRRQVGPVNPGPVNVGRRPISSPPIMNPAMHLGGNGVGTMSPQVVGGHPPTMATVANGMTGINAAPIQARTPVPVTQGPVGAAPGGPTLQRPMIRPQTRMR